MRTSEPKVIGSLLVYYRSVATDLVVGRLAADDEEPRVLTIWLNRDGEMVLGRVDVDNDEWYTGDVATPVIIEPGGTMRTREPRCSLSGRKQ